MRVSALFYRLARRLCEILPRSAAYRVAEGVASLYAFFSSGDKKAIRKNMKIIRGANLPACQERRFIREVFVNFARYLVDFLSFSSIDESFIRRYVRIEGEENLKDARADKKGVIILTAHLGNWELGGLIAGMRGHPLYAVALPHASETVNAFFNSQREMGNLKVIPLGTAVKRCFKLLKMNEMVAFVGDKEFGTNGYPTRMFGKKVLVPPGPAFFALKTGAAVVPSFMVREETFFYRLVFEAPIYSRDGSGKAYTFEQVMEAYIKVMERYIQAYATQWFMFSDYFFEDEKPGNNVSL